ncbi:hypothetical protein BegalDRAFT_0950 [Beggiatoa alba B18LD]|uniref:Uncharacterized protein n=1 Tax=Beggiatoa alba B18LD TaxID=395493 RepID=I3CE14_9GAMM|nr:hypothetical protein [Beggiatoa alba]EIJ41857.1 hypothetical protein BegalDRAFT_0950 [Beggiatoa alba B18LD]
MALERYLVLSVSVGKVDGNAYASVLVLAQDAGPQKEGKSGHAPIKVSCEYTTGLVLDAQKVLPCVCDIELVTIAGAGGKASAFAQAITPLKETVGQLGDFLKLAMSPPVKASAIPSAVPPPIPKVA